MENKKLKNVKISRAEYLSKEDREKHNLPDEGMIAMETWEVKTPEEMTSSLKAEVLEKVAKKMGLADWEHYKNYGHPPRPLDDWQEIEFAVTTALSAKQAEVEGELDDLITLFKCKRIDNIEYRTDWIITDLENLKKRLLASSQVVSK